MRHVLGRLHQARSDNAHARELLEAALAERRNLSGPDALETLAIQIDLAKLLAFIDEPDRARALLDDALARMRRAHGEDHPLVANAYHALAGLVERSVAQRHLERAVAIARHRLPATDQDRIRYITSLAGVYFSAGQRGQAKALYDEAQASAASLNGGRTPLLVGVLNDSAAADATLGDFNAAEAKHRRAIALAADLVGPESFQVANGLNNLAVMLVNQGRLREAADVFRQAHERHVALFGERHWRTINTMRNVGMMMLLLDDPQECARWMTHAVESKEAIGKTDRAAAYMRAQLARCYLRGGRTNDGISMLARAVGALENDGADTNRYTANARLWLATALLENRDADRAEPLATAAVEYYRRTSNASHPARAEAECELAHVLAARGRADAALALAQDCVPRIATYGQMVPWRKRSAEDLLRRLTAGNAERAGS